MDWETIYQRKPNKIEEYVLNTFHEIATPSDRRFIFPEIQPSINEGAKSTYLKIKPDEVLIAIFDETVFARNAKDGFAFTTKRIYWRNFGEQPKDIEYKNIAEGVMFSRSNKSNLELGGGLTISIRFSIDDNAKDTLINFLKAVQTSYKTGVFKKVPTANASPWHIAVAGKEYGPYNINEIEGLLLAEELNLSESLVWCEGMANWTPFMKVQEMAELMKSAKKVSLPPPPPTSVKMPPPLTTAPSLDNIEKTTIEDKSPVDLNNASMDDLLVLPGITIVKAKKIIDERNKRGGFKTIEDVGHFLDFQPHQVERLKEKAVLNSYQLKDVTSVKGRVVDF